MTERAFIAGGTGFVGVNAASELARRGYAVTVMGHSQKRPPGLHDSIAVLAGDSRIPGDWQDAVKASSLVLNLAGASIFSRWSAEHKKLIYDSRILTTRNIARALNGADHAVTFFSTSAVGYYGFHEDEDLDESSGPGTDFLATLCRDWEAEAVKAVGEHCRVVITRFGIVLGKSGGALGQMLPPFRYGFGGPVGSGRQWFSWIHMDDLLGALLFLLGSPGAEGPYNLTAPTPERNIDLARTIGKVMHRPSLIPAPAFAVRAALGEFGDVILKGQKVHPARLLEAGYTFQYQDLESALHSILDRRAEGD